MRDPLFVGPLPRRSLIIDLVLAAAFGVVAVAVHLEQSTAAVISVALVTPALALRRIAPSLMIGFALASAIVQVATVQIAVLVALAYFPIMLTLGSHPDRRLRFASLAAGLIGTVVAGFVIPHVYAIQGELFGVVFGFAATAAVVLGGWTAGFVRFQRQSVEQARTAKTIAELERRRLLDRYEEQSERSRLARDMHDVVAHSLAIVVAQADGARFMLATDPGRVQASLHTIAETARDALSDVRVLLEQLRTADPAGTTRFDQGTLFARMRSVGMTIQHSASGDPATASDDLRRVAHRVLVESLTNALKYGDLTKPVRVRHVWGDGCELTVRNEVSATPLAPGGAGQGIAGMVERAAHHGGRLRSARDGDGWTVELTLPPATLESHR
ncbi:sensor histidine kinase [Jongsikchunia kroppenstedtii]|uniref:sensor histidine kinase n=1 Tax=Jongsikchunia kroppenstedtii TaxID=1121721 RepID=UPI0004769888|nr:histidine kinase [Jongsikchunia kroppenstedtii]